MIPSHHHISKNGVDEAGPPVAKQTSRTHLNSQSESVCSTTVSPLSDSNLLYLLTGLASWPILPSIARGGFRPFLTLIHNSHHSNVLSQQVLLFLFFLSGNIVFSFLPKSIPHAHAFFFCAHLKVFRAGAHFGSVCDRNILVLNLDAH